MAPVGLTVEPPVIRTVPAEAVSAPAPEYVVAGVTSTNLPDAAAPMATEVVVDVAVTVPAVAVTAADVLSSV
jgi:hypothetical protein